MRLSGLALFVLALQYAPASAQALPLTDSLVIGFWDSESEEISPDDTSKADIRLAGFFTGQHEFEQTVWMKERWYPDTATVYTGLRMTGTWFIRDTLLGMITRTCVGFTETGRRECAVDSDGLGDTGYVTLEGMDLPGFGRSRVMKMTMENWELPIWRYEGPVRDMSDPDFWKEAPLALRPYRLLPESGNRTPAFDVLGRLPSGRAPVRLYPGPLPAPFRSAR